MFSSSRVAHLALLITASILAALAAATVHASLNKWQWDLYERMVKVERHGTQNAEDLSLYLADRMATWRLLDTLPPAGTPVTVVRSWRSVGPVAIPTRWLQPGNIPRMAAHALTALILSIAGATIAAAYAVRRPTTGLPTALRTLPEARIAFRDAIARSVLLTLALTPLLSAAAWYICFDRTQSRAFVADTFEPATAEWLTLGALLLITGGVIAFRRTPSIVRSRLPAAALRAAATCRLCGYPASHALATRCPECGAGLNTPRRKRLTWQRVSTCLTLIAAITIVAIAIHPPVAWLRDARKLPHHLALAANWLALRGAFFQWRACGTFSPEEIVTITWDDRVLQFAVLSVDLKPDPTWLTFGNPGFALVWIEEDLNNSAPHVNQPNIRMAGVADPDYAKQCVLDTTGLTVRSSFTPGAGYNLVRFDLSRRIRSFSRTPFDKASPEQRRRLIDPLLQSIKERGVKIFPTAIDE